MSGSNEAKARWKDARFARGLCIVCGKAPARVDRVHCWDCGARDCKRRAWLTTPRLRRCTGCRTVTSHDVRRCPVREPGRT